MNENRRQVLEMLAAGKITADEAERLIAALEQNSSPAMGDFPCSTTSGTGANATAPKSRAKFLRVLVEADESMTGMKGQTQVDVRVPMQLLRAGVRLASLIPVQAHQHLDDELSRHGVPLTLSQIKPENLEELIDHLEDLTVDVNGSEVGSTKVRVFCE
jgi:hypothetical protein